MTQERYDPWALLREAQEQIERGDTYFAGYRDLLARIDAALAAHEAEQQVTWLSNGKALDASVNGYLVEVRPSYAGDGWWAWKAEQFPVHRDRQHGHKRTMEQAQEAAIAAARGMK